MRASEAQLAVEGLSKTFTIHLQGGARLVVLRELDLRVARGECVALVGPSGAGKSTLLRCIYGNFRASSGRILADEAPIRAEQEAALRFA